MKYQATVSFTGSLTMSQNDIREISDEIAKNLVECGYLFPLESKKKPQEPPPAQEPQEPPPAQEPQEPPPAQEPQDQSPVPKTTKDKSKA